MDCYEVDWLYVQAYPMYQVSQGQRVEIPGDIVDSLNQQQAGINQAANQQLNENLNYLLIMNLKQQV